MSSTFNRISFFVMLGFFFIIFFFATKHFYSTIKPESKFSKGAIVSLSAIIFSLFFVGYTQLTGVLKIEGFSYKPPKQSIRLCQGGSYLWQGNSERSKFCRNLASTPEGLAKINSQTCNKGMSGIKGIGFRDTPMSNGSWKNEMCDSTNSTH